IKQSAIALTAQAAQLLKNEAFLQNFEGVSDAAAQAVATLLRVGADFVPIFTLAGGAVLIFTRNLDTLILTARIAFAILVPGGTIVQLIGEAALRSAKFF